MSFLKGEINYLLVKYITENEKTIERIALIEIVTDPYGNAGSVGNIYSYTKYELELPSEG